MMLLKNKKGFIHLLLIVLSPSLSISQNKIYTEAGQKDGKVIEIAEEKIKYKNPLNPGPFYSLSKNNAKLVFNEKGRFLVIPGLDSVPKPYDQQLINSFINYQNDSLNNYDQIFTRLKKRLDCVITNEDERSFQININEVDLSIEKSSVACVIYKNGSHKIITDINTLTDLLSFYQKNEVASLLQKSEIKIKPQAELKNKEVFTQRNVPQEQVKKAVAEDLKIENEEASKKQTILAVSANEKKLKADSIASINTINKAYKQAVQKGLAFYKKGDFINAKASYEQAAALKPDEDDLVIKLDSLNQKIEAEKVALEMNIKYDSTIAIADSFLVLNMWYDAINNYKKGLDIKPGEYYPKKQIKFLQTEITKKEEEDKIKEEIRKKQEQEKRYQDALTKGEVAAKEKKYEEALAAYNEALLIHPENDFVQSRVKIMIYQVSKLKQAVQ